MTGTELRERIRYNTALLGTISDYAGGAVKEIRNDCVGMNDQIEVINETVDAIYSYLKLLQNM